MKAKLRLLLIGIIDVFVALTFILASPTLWLSGRIGRHMRLTRRVTDWLELSVVRHHYYEPVVFPKDLKYPLSNPRLLPGLDMNVAGQTALLADFSYQEELRAIPMEQVSSTEFAFENPSFASGDAEIYYCIVRHFQPERIIEVGAGQSTLVAVAAISKNKAQNFDCTLTAIEPFEQAWLEALPIEVVREKVEDCSIELFKKLQKNDILFIDSSHVIRPQGDVLHEILQILPQLNPGVLVHFHDIFTPRDYLDAWVKGERKLWNEQYLLEAFLSHNRDFEILSAVNFLHHERRAELAQACPIIGTQPDREPGSFWIRRKMEAS